MNEKPIIDNPALDQQYTAAQARMDARSVPKWTGTRQRDDLRTCPFCDTAAVQQVRLADNTTNVHYRIGCGNPFCSVEPNTPPSASLLSAEQAWNERAPQPTE